MSISMRTDEIILDFKVEPVIQHHVQELLKYLGEQCPDDLYDILTGNYQIALPNIDPVKNTGNYMLNFDYTPSKRELEQFSCLMSGQGGLWNNRLFSEGSSWFPSCLPKDIYCYLLYIGRSTNIGENTWTIIDQIDKYWYYHLNALAYENPDEYKDMLCEFNSRYDEWRQTRLEAEEKALKELNSHVHPHHGPKSLMNAYHLYNEKKYYRGFPMPSSWTITRRGFKNKVDKAIRSGNLSKIEDIVDYRYIENSFPLGLPNKGKLTEGAYRILEYYLTGNYKDLYLYLQSISIPRPRNSKKNRDENEELPGTQTVHSFCGHKTMYKIPEDLNQFLHGNVKLMSILIAYPRSNPMDILKQGITEEILSKRNTSLGYIRDLKKEPYYCLQIPRIKDPRYQYISILPQSSKIRKHKPYSKSLQVPKVPDITPNIELTNIDTNLDIKARVSFITGITEHGPVHRYYHPPTWNTGEHPMHYCGDQIFTEKYNPTDFSELYSDDDSEYTEYTISNIMNKRKERCLELNQMLHAIALVYRIGDYNECEVFKSYLGNLDDITLVDKLKDGTLVIPNYKNGKFDPHVILFGYNSIVPHQHINYSAPTFQAITPLEHHDQLQKIGEYKRYATSRNHYIYTKRKKYTCMIYKHGLSHWSSMFINVKDMIDLFTHVNYLDLVILRSILTQNSCSIPDTTFYEDSDSSDEDTDDDDDESDGWNPEVPVFGLIPSYTRQDYSSTSSSSPHSTTYTSLSPYTTSSLSSSPHSTTYTSLSPHTTSSLSSSPHTTHNMNTYTSLSPHTSTYTIHSMNTNEDLVQVCGKLAVYRHDLNLYTQILEKLKQDRFRKSTRTVTKFMKYVVVFDMQTHIPMYRAYENGTAVLYDAVYPVPNSNFLWISEHERTQGEKKEAKLNLQKCKKIPGLYYPKMSGEFILTEMSSRLEEEMKDERIYAYNMILKHREPGVLYDKTIDSNITKLISQPIIPSIIVEPEYIYNQYTGLVCAAIVLDHIVPCLSIYKYSRVCSNTIPLMSDIENYNNVIPFPGKKTMYFPVEFKGYKVRMPTSEELIQMKKKWEENALTLDSIRQAHYIMVQTIGSEFLQQLHISEVNWEYVNDFFKHKKSASNILGAIYTEMLSERQKELYLDIAQVEISEEMINNYFKYLPTNYTNFQSGVPSNLNEYICQQKRILSCKTVEAARAYISTLSLNNKKHKDYVETESEKILKEAKKRELAKKRRSHTVVAPGPTADGYTYSVSGLKLQSDPYVMCSSTQYKPAGILSDQEIPVNTTDTYNPGKWTDITSAAYIPGIPERKTIDNTYSGYISKDVYVATEEDLLIGRRSFHRKSIYPKVCQILIEQGWIHPCDRLLDRDDGLIFTTEEDIYIAFHGDYDLQIPNPKYLLYLCTLEEIPFYYRTDFDVDIHRPRSHLLSEIPKFTSRTKKIAAARREYLKRYAINCFLHKLNYVHTILNIIRTDSLRLGMMGVKYLIVPNSTTVAMYKCITKTAHHAHTIFTSKPSIPYSSGDTTSIHQIYKEVTVITQSGIISHYIGMIHNVKSDVLNLGYKSPEIYTHTGELMLDIWYIDQQIPEMFEIICKLPLSPDKCLYYFTREYLRLITMLTPYERYQLFLYYYKRIGDYLAEIQLRIPGQTPTEKNIELVIDAAIIYSLRQTYSLESAAINICQDPYSIKQRHYVLSQEEEYVREILDKKMNCQRSGVKFVLGVCTSTLAQTEKYRIKRSEMRSTWERKLEQDQQYANTQVNYYRKYLISIYKDNTRISEVAKAIKSDATVIEELTEDLYQRISESLPEQLPKSFWYKYYGYEVKSLERIYHRYVAECIYKEEVVLSHDLMLKLININESELQEMETSVYTQSRKFTCSLTDWIPKYRHIKYELPKLIANPYDYLMQNSCSLDKFCSYRGNMDIIMLNTNSKFQPWYWKSVLVSSNPVKFHVHPSINNKMYIYYNQGALLYLMPKITIEHLPSNITSTLPLEIQNYVSLIEPINISSQNIPVIEDIQECVPAGIKPRIAQVNTIPVIENQPLEVPKSLLISPKQNIDNDIQKLYTQKNWTPTNIRPVLRSRTENANSAYDISDLKWNGTYLGKFPKVVILSTIKYEKLDIVELLLPLIDKDGTLHHYNVQCLMFNVKNKLGAVMDELAPSFGLQKVGTHTLTIQNTLRLVYRLEHSRPFTLYNLKDFSVYSPEFQTMLERIIVYQNFCLHPLDEKYILLCNGRLATLLPKCLSNCRKTNLKYMVRDSEYTSTVESMLKYMSTKYSVIMEQKASQLAPDCLEYISTLTFNIRRSTFVT